MSVTERKKEQHRKGFTFDVHHVSDQPLLANQTENRQKRSEMPRVERDMRPPRMNDAGGERQTIESMQRPRETFGSLGTHVYLDLRFILSTACKMITVIQDDMWFNLVEI